MKTALGGLAVCVMALLACRGGGANWEMVGNNTVVVTCPRTAECYEGATQACPYGYDAVSHETQTTGAIANSHRVGNSVQTTIIPVRRGELVVQCKPPTFCEHAACPSGSTCVKSERFPGRAVCSIQY